MRLSIWPGLALAGGVVIAAVIALLVIGGAPGADHGNLPSATGPGDTRLFPSGHVAAQTGSGVAGHGAARVNRRAGPSPTSDAAVVQYDGLRTRGPVLADP